MPKTLKTTLHTQIELELSSEDVHEIFRHTLFLLVRNDLERGMYELGLEDLVPPKPENCTKKDDVWEGAFLDAAAQMICDAMSIRIPDHMLEDALKFTRAEMSL